MPTVFSDHAEQQLARRKITKEIVLEVIKRSEIIITSFRGRKLRQLEIGGKLLEVVTKTEGSRITVITAYFLED